MAHRRLTSALVVVVTALTSCAMIDRYTGEDVNAEVRARGFPAKAEVLEIWDTGVRLNDDPVVGFRLRVMLDDGSSYEATTKNVVSILQIPQIQPGAVLRVKVDPDDRQRVALDSD